VSLLGDTLHLFLAKGAAGERPIMCAGRVGVSMGAVNACILRLRQPEA
jgi:hypothetical protein